MIDTYIKEIASITKRGDAREESYYPVLATLLEEFSETKDRKGRELSSEEAAHYAMVVTAIAETIKIQQSLDDLFREVETHLLEISI